LPVQGKKKIKIKVFIVSSSTDYLSRLQDEAAAGNCLHTHLLISGVVQLHRWWQQPSSPAAEHKVCESKKEGTKEMQRNA
jgi:hypothetical protein